MPHAPESSGWNWHASTGPRSNAATKGPPCYEMAQAKPGGGSIRRYEFAKYA